MKNPKDVDEIEITEEMKVRANEIHRKVLESINHVSVSWVHGAIYLKQVRDEQLFRVLNFKSFKEYCEKVCEVKRRQAYNYINVIEKFDDQTVQSNAHLGIEKLQLVGRAFSTPEERKEFLESKHLVHSTAMEKEVSEITVLELKEVLKDKNMKHDEEHATYNIQSLLREFIIEKELEEGFFDYVECWYEDEQLIDNMKLFFKSS